MGQIRVPKFTVNSRLDLTIDPDSNLSTEFSPGKEGPSGDVGHLRLHLLIKVMGSEVQSGEGWFVVFWVSKSLNLYLPMLETTEITKGTDKLPGHCPRKSDWNRYFLLFSSLFPQV